MTNTDLASHDRLDMPRIALITYPEHPGLQPDDTELPATFADLGVFAEPLAWGSAVEPGCYDLALLRTPWDYFERPRAFLEWLAGVDVPVLNDPRYILWNHHKRYLLELEAAGAARLPATKLIPESERPEGAAQLLRDLGSDRLVLKPAVSGGAFRTRVLGPADSLAWAPEDSGDFVAQAYVPEIEASGEWSVMVFGGEVSHSIRKTPARGDFRVQAEHGGAVHAEPVPAELARVALRVVRAAEELVTGAPPLTYARVDLVWDGACDPALMELELIEPELFFRCDAEAPARFARAVTARLG